MVRRQSTAAVVLFVAAVFRCDLFSRCNDVIYFFLLKQKTSLEYHVHHRRPKVIVKAVSYVLAMRDISCEYECYLLLLPLRLPFSDSHMPCISIDAA